MDTPSTMPNASAYTSRMNRFVPLAFVVLSVCAIAVQRPDDRGGDLSLGRLLIDGEDWQLVAEGLGFADGPLTDAEGNFYFSDMKAPAIYRIALDGTRTTLIDELASGLKFGPDGRLYACQGAKKRLIAVDLATKAIEVIASDVQPNDLVISRAGMIYFTETGKKQVTRIDLKTKTVSAADTGITAPNGITLSPDQGTLAVSDYRGANVWTFRVEADGSLSSKAPYMTMRRPVDPKGEFARQEPPPCLAASGGDGMCSDAEGRFYVATTLGVQVFDPTGRECGLLPRIQMDKPLTSCALAGAGRAFLYVTNGDKIFRRKVQATGTVFGK
jgi:sugar lactone lactonase YvrE